MIADGAAIIDVGGESTRPGAAAVSVQEELDRVIPVISALVKKKILISVDTSRPQVMQAAIEMGAAIVNDVRAFTMEGALEVVAKSDVGVCLMHMKGQPDSMQNDPQYEDVITEVSEFLQERAQACQRASIQRDRIVIDPGFGFGKTVDDNLRLIKQLNAFVKLHYPVLMGISRKSTIGKVLDKKSHERLSGGLALTVMAVTNGAKIIRTHDVGPTQQAVEMAMAVLNTEQEVTLNDN